MHFLQTDRSVQAPRLPERGHWALLSKAEGLTRPVANVVCSLASAPAVPAPIRALASEHTTASKTRRLLTVTLTLVLTSLALPAATLESNNPFLPPGYGKKTEAPPQPVVTTNGPISREIEFRGLVKSEGAYEFSVFNKADQKSYWLSENEANEAGIMVRGYDAKSRSITVNMNGRSERLTLMSSSQSPIPVVSSMAAPNKPNLPTPTLPPGLANNPNANNNNANSDNRRRVIPRRRVILPKK